MKNDYYAVLMAGGIGSRFWPVSTERFPKQFHDLLGTGESLLQNTFNRLNKIIPQDQILILTNAAYKELVLEQLPQISNAQLVLEPAMRNTAPCILMAALKIKKRNPNALMLVAPSDHWIEDEAEFVNQIKTSFDACKTEEVLMTLGIKPTFPNTGYGYIKFDKESDHTIKPVIKFTEKPDLKTAKQFLLEGNYLWNAGIFIWSVASILKAFQENLKTMYALFEKGMPHYNTSNETAFIEEEYHKAENISIDYGILEKAKNVSVLSANFDWSDLGTWGALYSKLKQENSSNVVINAKAILENASGNLIYAAANKKVVVEGLEDYIIVDKDDVLLIVPKHKEQEIKEISKAVKQKFE